MANDTILTPGGEHWEPTEAPQEVPYLERDKYLSEYESEGEKAIVRDNLGVYPRDSVYTKTESDTKLEESINKAFQKYLAGEDPHKIIPKVEQMLVDFIKNDGTTPFKAPQQGVDPISDFHLATKRFVEKILKDHINSEDPHKIIPEVEDILIDYVKQSDVYFKKALYTKDEIDTQNKEYIRKDGTTPFTKAQIGTDPQIDSHLTTKRYVDKEIYKHIIEVDPHGFVSLLNERLALYAKAANVYDKKQTYSRVQLDGIIRGLVFDAAKEAIQDHLNHDDPHNIMDKVRAEKFVKQDGSVPFRNPQKGIDAVDPQDLITLHQVEEKVEGLKTELDKKPQPIWITSGPVETTVGFVEDDQEVPREMTLQEIMDAIFYGQLISLDVPDYVTIGNKCDVTMCIHGSLALVEKAELYQGDELIYTFEKDAFENGCVTVDSLPIYDDTQFTFKVYYTNGSTHQETKLVKCSLPVFVGLLPKWKFANTITMEYLQELESSDIEGYQNRFLDYGDNVKEIPFEYHFEDAKLRHPFLVVPISYPDLEKLVTDTQKFEVEAFDIIDRIPLTIPGIEKDIIFKIYVYRQALSSLNQTVTFKF